MVRSLVPGLAALAVCAAICAAVAPAIAATVPGTRTAIAAPAAAATPAVAAAPAGGPGSGNSANRATGRSSRPAQAPAAKPDFNGDGYADLAIASPRATVSGQLDAGSVNVIYGSSTGLATASNQLWTQDSTGILGEADQGDLFGTAVATGDFNGDGYSDLAIGVRYEDLGARASGAVNVIYGSPAGLTAVGNQLWGQARPGIKNAAEAGDQFGKFVIAADFNGDGYDDMAVGVRWETVFAYRDGAVNVIYGSPTGLKAAGNQFWDQNSAGMLDQSEANDQFGQSLTAADFNGDGYADLAIGVPYESYHAVRDGIVQVIYGSAAGLNASGNQLWSQDSPGILDKAQLRDQFGQSLAAGDFDHDGYGDLAVGIWFQDFDTRRIGDEGAMAVIYGSAIGLASNRNQFWSQDSPGILDQADQGDQWSQSLGVADFNGDGYDDIAVGSPWEEFGNQDVYEDRGAVNVIYGSATGLSAAGNQFWDQDSPGILDKTEINDRFGESLAGADFNRDGYADLAVGVPYESYGGHHADGVVQIIDGSASELTATGNQLWSADTPGILGVGETAALFGWTTSSVQPASVSSRLCVSACK